MISPETNQILRNLARIEDGLARLYRHFSEMGQLPPPVKKFWQAISEEEEAHARVFEDIRKRAEAEERFVVETEIDLEELKSFVRSVNDLIEEIKGRELDESQAYSYGAAIEGKFSESQFLDKLNLSDQGLTLKIRSLKNATKKHGLIMVNYSRGIK